MIGGVTPATARRVRWVRKAIRGSMWVSLPRCAPSITPPPPPHRCQRNRCPCSECCVRREFSTTGEVSFRAKAALAVGRRRGASRWGGPGWGPATAIQGGERLNAVTGCRRPAVKCGWYPGVRRSERRMGSDGNGGFAVGGNYPII